MHVPSGSTMSALADFSHKFGSQPREVKIGQSFFDDADTVFHTVRYDFVPASIDPNKTSAIEFGENGKVTITMPNVEGSGTTESVYQGQRKPHQKECVLIINHETGDIILERLNQSMIVKKARLRQEDLTGKSLALNKTGCGSASSSSSVPFIHINGNGSIQASVNNHSPSSSLLNSNGQAKNNPNMDKKSASLLVASHNNNHINGKNGQKSPISSGKKPKSPSLLMNGNMNNGNAVNNAGNGVNLSRTTNGISNHNGNNKLVNATISPNSMPIFNTNTSNKSNANNNSSNCNDNNSDWKIKVPDLPIEANSKLKSHRRINNQQPSNTANSTASNNCLSDSSSSDSSDSEEGESSSDHFSDSNNRVNNGANNAKTIANNVQARSGLTAPSMPSFANVSMPTSNGNTSGSVIMTKTDSPELTDGHRLHQKQKHTKKNALALSEDSDSSDQDDGNDKKNLNSSLFKSKTNNNNHKNHKSLENNNSQSMPIISQLSQDLQLSESDSDD